VAAAVEDPDALRAAVAEHRPDVAVVDVRMPPGSPTRACGRPSRSAAITPRSASWRIFFDHLIRDNLDIGRPDQVSLIFDRKIIRKGKHATPGRFRTRVITDGVTPSLRRLRVHGLIQRIPHSFRYQVTTPGIR
jgi:hypothetical protein